MRNPIIGERVVTNNLEWGRIESVQPGSERDPSGPWYDVRLDNGRREMQNAPRMTRSHPFGDADPAVPSPK